MFDKREINYSQHKYGAAAEAGMLSQRSALITCDKTLSFPPPNSSPPTFFDFFLIHFHIQAPVGLTRKTRDKGCQECALHQETKFFQAVDPTGVEDGTVSLAWRTRVQGSESCSRCWPGCTLVKWDSHKGILDRVTRGG